MKLNSLTKPFTHQARELEDYWDSFERALFWEMRTGKTKVVIDSVANLFNIGKVVSLLIIAPKGPHENWIKREFPKHCFFKWQGHAWSAQNVMRKHHKLAVDNIIATAIKRKNLAVLAINKESLLSEHVVKIIKLLLKAGPTYLVVDESHHFGKPGAKQTKRIRALSKRCKYKRILTGKPIGNSPLRLFSQFEILKPGALGFQKYSDFKMEYSTWEITAIKKRKFERLVGYKNLDKLREKITRYTSIVLRSDCEDLPEIINTNYYYEPSPIQILTYRKLFKNQEVEINGKRVIAKDGGSKLTKLQQILSNFAIVDDFTITTIDLKRNPRIEAVFNILKNENKSIIWCRFVEDIKRLKVFFKKEKIPFVEYYGATPDNEREKAIDLFQNDATIKVFLGQPSSGAGEGIDLSAADVIIWYSHIFDVVARDQASARASAPGKATVGIIDLIASPGGVDSYILKNLLKKRSIETYVAGETLKKMLDACKI